jgi:hypothetical protein
MDEILKFFGTMIGKMIIGTGTVAVAVYNHLRLNKKRNRVNQRTFSSKAKNQVEDLIENYRILTRANRVNLWQYSNGEKDLVGICYERVNCSAESVDDNTKSIKDQFKMVFLDRNMRRIINNIADSKGDFYVMDLDSDDEQDRNEMELSGLGTSFHFKIFKNNVWGGVVSFNFVRRTELTTQQQHDMLICMSQISSLHAKMIK